MDESVRKKVLEELREELRKLSEYKKSELRREISIEEGTHIPDFEQGASKNIRVDELLKGLQTNYVHDTEEYKKLNDFMDESKAPYLYFIYRCQII